MSNAEPFQVVIVDDTYINLKILSTLLEKEGFRTVKVDSSVDAVATIAEVQPDLVLLDIAMPQMDGYEVCSQLKANDQTTEIPVIFISALEHVNDKVKAFDVGGVDYILKPFKHQEVLARVNSHLQSRLWLNQVRSQDQALEAAQQERDAMAQTLAETQAKLDHVQGQLVHMEKMASLGQLLAGIAHEINNPMNFIHGNIQPAKDYVQDLLEVVQQYQDSNPNPPAAVVQLLEDVDFDFVAEDLPKLINSIALGSDRIREIVLSLRNFSRTDEAAPKAAMIHENIESTLLILRYYLKAKNDFPGVTVHKHYGQIPPVVCYAGQLNQVLMNLVVNGVDTMESRFYEERARGEDNYVPTLEIATHIVDHHLHIQIKDNGQGMSEAHQQKMFDSFFTTKPKDKGTGLGLAIAQEIIHQKHRGRLRCQSQVGVGTEFTIEIPLDLGEEGESS